jgi:hypothetical protein
MPQQEDAPAGAATAKPAPPASVTHFGLNLVALVVVLVTLYVLRQRQVPVVEAVPVLCVVTAIPIVLLDLSVLRVHRRETTGLDWGKAFDFDLRRVLTKLLGLAFTLGLIALTYWVTVEYHGSFYDPLYNALVKYWRWLTVATIAYVALVDGKMREPRDGYWQMGRVVLLRLDDARAWDIANHLRGWLVKAFFFPLMFVWLHGNVREVLTFSFAGWPNVRLHDFLNSLLYLLDLLFTTVGYALSMRVIDTHLRTAEPTMFGWAVALFCYQPFYSVFERNYVSYGGNYFGAWLAHSPGVMNVWSAAILGLVTIYVLATIAFGVRFSNLTHRGILTNGPYRYTKHPAYISKNLSWWLIAIPFLPLTGWENAVRHSLALGCINMIYFLRARTEERHLSRDPTYVAYALWINEHGTLAFLGRWFPLLKYKPPANMATQPQPEAGGARVRGIPS